MPDISITQYECDVLFMVLDRIGGDQHNSPRKHIATLYDKIAKFVDTKAVDAASEMLVEEDYRYIYFKDYDGTSCAAVKS